MLRSLFSLIFLLLAVTVSAQRGYDITVRVDGYSGKFITLANNLVDNQYLVDTAYATSPGVYRFQSDTAWLDPGIYLGVLPPENNYFQFVIGDDGDREFSLSTSADDLGKVTAKGSKENKLFFDYMSYLAENQQRARPLRTTLQDSVATEEQRADARRQLDELDQTVTRYQDEVIQRHPASFVAAIIRTTSTVTPPDFADVADEDERRMLQYRYVKEHYLDSIDLTDERLLRTSFLHGILERYVQQLTVQHPDSMAASIDEILGKATPGGELFKHYLIYFTNQAANSKYIGMDALYVHLMDRYYLSGKADWADEDQLRKFRESVDRIRPLLIGRKAPDITVENRDGERINLYDTEAKYTILYFWRYDCGSCKKSTPHMQAFYEKWKEKDVALIAVCVKGQKDIPECWEYIDEKEIQDWMHGVDPYQRYYKAYDVRSTPMMFVLDREKNIIMKRLSAEQLDGFLTEYDARPTDGDGTK